MEIRMAKAPKSERASSEAETAAQKSNERASSQPPDDRIAELDRRVAALAERLAVASETAAVPAPIDARLMEQQNERIAALHSLLGNLGEQLTTFQAVNARDKLFNDAVHRVEAAAAAVQRGLAPVSEPGIAVAGSPPGRDCGCGPCDCVSCSCCTFEIWMSDARVDQMQTLEPTDSNLVPGEVMEVWMFASIDPINNIGICHPGPSPISYMPLHKQITDPTGPWEQVSRKVGTVTVKKGVSLNVEVKLTVVEREISFLEKILPPGNREEWGSNSAYVTLDCCYSNYSPIDVPVLLTSWGQGGGAVTGRFKVVKQC